MKPLKSWEIGLFIGDFVEVTLGGRVWDCLVVNENHLATAFGIIYVDALPYLPFGGYDRLKQVNREIADNWNLKVGDSIEVIAYAPDIKGVITEDYTLLTEGGAELNLILLDYALIVKVYKEGKWVVMQANTLIMREER